VPGGRDHETAMRLLKEEGVALQWAWNDGDNNWVDYEEDAYLQLFAISRLWRIKPTQWYRVGKYTNIGGSTRFVLVQDEASEQFYNKNTSFRG